MLVVLGGIFGVCGSDVDTVLDRMRSEWIPAAGVACNSSVEAANHLASLLFASNCTFSDIDYSNRRRADWPVMAHLGRVVELAAAGVCGSDAGLVHWSVCALNWWLVERPTDPNWYDQEIAAPNNIGEALVVLGTGALKANQTAAAEALINEADWRGWTGSNLLFMLRAEAMRGAATGNSTALAEAFSEAFSAVHAFPQSSDGPQHDWSFHQHGPQLLSGSYGAEFVQHVLEMALWASDTQWAMQGASADALEGLVLEGDRHLIRLQSWDWQVVGRSITVPPGHTDSAPASLPPQWLRAVGKGRERQSEWDAFADSLQNLPNASFPTAAKSFWDSDFACVSRPNWSASLHMHSKRTIGGACVNDQGKLEGRLGEGALALYGPRGGDYDGAFPLFDFLRPPGVAGAMDGTQLNCGNAKPASSASFVGAVDDKRYAAAAMHVLPISTNKLSARRSWFFLDNAIFAFLSSISASSPVAVTLNTVPLHSPKVYSSTSPNTPLPLPTNLSNATDSWILANSIGYIPNLSTSTTSTSTSSPTTHLFVGEKTGDWSALGVQTGNVTLPVLDLSRWIEPAQDASLSYAMFPDVSSVAQMQTLAKTLGGVQPFQSDEATAVWDTNAHVMMATFWDEDASVNSAWTVTASQPCLLIARNASANHSVLLTAAVPDLSGENISITFATRLQCASCTQNQQQSTTTVVFSLPDGDVGQSAALWAVVEEE